MNVDMEKPLPFFSKAPHETYTNWMNRRKMCAGLEYEPYIDPWPLDTGEYWQYPRFKVKKENLEFKRILSWHEFITNQGGEGTWKDRYAKYIQSPEWKQVRSRKITNSGSICEICKKFYSSVQVHHLHYRTVGEEGDGDLMVVCKTCHPKLDEERKRRSQAQSENNAFTTFCLKKYGAVLDSATAYDEFYQWQNNKEIGYGNEYCSEDNYGDF